MSFVNNRLSDTELSIARSVLEGKAKPEFEFDIPEDVAKEDVGDFVVAAAAAKKAGKKEFEFGGKKFPVTIKTDIKTEEEDKEDDKEDDKKVKNDVEVNPEIDEAVVDEAKMDAAGLAKEFEKAITKGKALASDRVQEKERMAILAKAKKAGVDTKAVDKAIVAVMNKLNENGVAGGQYSPIKKFDSPKYEDEVEVIDNLPEGAMKQFHQMMDDGATAQEIAKALKIDVKVVKKLMKEDKDFHPDHFLAIKEVFEEFMAEGTMASGIFSRNKAEAQAAMDALKDLMRKKLPVGRDGSSSAIEDKMYDIVFDDELFDGFDELRDEKGDNADARPLIRARLKQLRVRV